MRMSFSQPAFSAKRFGVRRFRAGLGGGGTPFNSKAARNRRTPKRFAKFNRASVLEP